MEWAQANDVRDDVISFIARRPDALVRPVPKDPAPFSTPRSWASLSRALDLVEAAGLLDPSIRSALAHGRVSADDAATFCNAAQPNSDLPALVVTALRLLKAGAITLTPGNKICDIKALRQETACGLREAKDAVEAVMAMSNHEIARSLNTIV